MTMIHQSDLRDILNEAGTDEEIRARIEELADLENADEEQRTFVEMITELDRHLAKAAGVKPKAIDPEVDRYYPTGGNPLRYKIGGYEAVVNAGCKYQSVSSVEVKKDVYEPLIADFHVAPVGPEKVTELVVDCINTLNKK